MKHNLGRKTTQRGRKLFIAVPCETRERLLETYRNAECDREKQINIFTNLMAHENKHGCGKRNRAATEIPTFAAVEADIEDGAEPEAIE